ncbi:hypothetical protein Hanom_Chr09g00811081 [Helianthus anomalus]
MHLPATLRWLPEHRPMEHRHIIMQPNRKPYKRLPKPQQFRNNTRISRKNQHNVHQKHQKVQHIRKRLQQLQANISVLRSSVEKLQRFETGYKRGECEY